MAEFRFVPKAVSTMMPSLNLTISTFSNFGVTPLAMGVHKPAFWGCFVPVTIDGEIATIGTDQANFTRQGYISPDLNQIIVQASPTIGKTPPRHAQGVIAEPARAGIFQAMPAIF